MDFFRKPYLGGDWHFTALKLVKDQQQAVSKDLDAFDAIQQQLHQQETEVGDKGSLLEGFRKFAVDHDLEWTREDDGNTPCP